MGSAQRNSPGTLGESAKPRSAQPVISALTTVTLATPNRRTMRSARTLETTVPAVTVMER